MEIKFRINLFFLPRKISEHACPNVRSNNVLICQTRQMQYDNNNVICKNMITITRKSTGVKAKELRLTFEPISLSTTNTDQDSKKDAKQLHCRKTVRIGYEVLGKRILMSINTYMRQFVSLRSNLYTHWYRRLPLLKAR